MMTVAGGWSCGAVPAAGGWSVDDPAGSGGNSASGGGTCTGVIGLVPASAAGGVMGNVAAAMLRAASASFVPVFWPACASRSSASKLVSDAGSAGDATLRPADDVAAGARSDAIGDAAVMFILRRTNGCAELTASGLPRRRLAHIRQSARHAGYDVRQRLLGRRGRKRHGAAVFAVFTGWHSRCNPECGNAQPPAEMAVLRCPDPPNRGIGVISAASPEAGFSPHGRKGSHA